MKTGLNVLTGSWSLILSGQDVFSCHLIASLCFPVATVLTLAQNCSLSLHHFSSDFCMTLGYGVASSIFIYITELELKWMAAQAAV